MNLIVCVDKNWAIGKKGKLLASIRDDMEFFREKTLGGAVIMGRKTLESLPGGRPLPDRVNIVLSSNPSYKAPEGVILCRTVDEVLSAIKDYKQDRVFSIGGGSVYKLLLPYCDTAYVTKIDFAYDADTFFPNLDKDEEWELSEKSPEHTSFDLSFFFCTYRRK